MTTLLTMVIGTNEAFDRGEQGSNKDVTISVSPNVSDLVGRIKSTLHDGSTLTYPFADNNILFMLTDWQPIVGITFQDCSTMTDTKIVGMSVADETNQNLSPKQKSYSSGTGNSVTVTLVGSSVWLVSVVIKEGGF
jgi:hypothetical protein